MLEKEVRAIAQNIVNKAKASARRDTGWLKRSISYTVTGNVYLFRQVYYGQFKDNSKLEQYARQLMPNGVKWQMVYTDRQNRIVERGAVKTGRNSVAKILRNTTTAVANLINRIRGKKKN